MWRRKAYPHILACGGLTDQRVAYWEPAKWVARLRERKSDDHLLLLNIDMEAGHDGASGRYEELDEMALKFAFAIKVDRHGRGRSAARLRRRVAGRTVTPYCAVGALRSRLCGLRPLAQS